MTQDRRFELERRWIGLESEILHECLTDLLAVRSAAVCEPER